jgi:hypothetical protein
MSRPALPLRFLLAISGVAMSIIAALCLLPHDRYVRFLSVTDPVAVKQGWIYERIHYDPSPIDVVFIGTSHSVFGINSGKVEAACRASGGGHCASVNFALQHLGRNLNWLEAREVLQYRRPKLLVIEVQEYEPRAMHPAFPYFAESGDLLAAPLIINTTYFADLARLPLRQLSLFGQSMVPSLFGTRLRFEPALYRGAHWEDTYAQFGSPERPILHPEPRTTIHTAAELEYERAHPQGAESGAPKLPPMFRPLEYRATFIYLDMIMALAREKGVAVRFLYMPSFGISKAPDFASYYHANAPMWMMPPDIINNAALWSDVGHLNSNGADAFSTWLGGKIAKEDPQIPLGSFRPSTSDSQSEAMRR